MNPSYSPNCQSSGSNDSALRLSFGEKNGRRIVYAFDSITFGNTCSVPSCGAVSLSASQPWYVRNTVDWFGRL